MKQPGGITIKQTGFDPKHINKLINGGHFEAAKKLLSKAAKKSPRDFDVLFLQGKLASSRFQLDEAQQLFQRAMANAKTAEKKGQALFQISTILYHNRKLDEARSLLESHICGQFRDDKFTHQYLKILRDSKDREAIDEAIPHLLQRDPHNLQCLGLCLQCLIQSSQIDRAIEVARYFLDQRLGRYPDRTVVMLLGCYEAKGEFEEASKVLHQLDKDILEEENVKRELCKLDYFLTNDQSIVEELRDWTQSKSRPLAKWTLSTLDLKNGDFERGLTEYEARYASVNKTIRVHFLPYHNLSSGLPEDGSRILLSYEQGLGDMVRFCRYLDGLSESAAKRIAVLPEPRLVPLIRRSFPSIQCYADGKVTLKQLEKDNIKKEAMLASAALINEGFGTKPENGYFKVDESVRQNLMEIFSKDVPSIGVFWRSIKHNPERSLWYPPLEEFVEMFRGLNCQLVSLQNDVTDAEREAFDKIGLKLIETDIDCREDIDGLAALCASVDTVVGVGTATAEISAATGRTTWQIANHHPDRWYLSQKYLDGHYRDIRVALNKTGATWVETLKGVRTELEQFLDA